ncbi:MAG: hypothetical protein A3A86_05915 [Elusimicrobia bacterium RIFCSPLOWO2_01_FULL_60_11]|nr:MAG: hypothetical protein A3A86_05915 [Elusimicrobia bacterium RIFCSPLOWO2_01_FULL_60_11]
MSSVLSAGIIAAGEGSRFRQRGFATHKPMLQVAGYPLIGHALRNLQSAGIRRVAVIFNEEEPECAAWVRAHFAGLAPEILIKSTASSFESFWLVGRLLGAGRHLLTTVDAFCLPHETRKMAALPPEEGLALGVTSFVDDEKPLWVDMDEKSGKISEIGLAGGKYATAGFYNVPGSIFEKRPDGDIASLRFFLKWLVKNGTPAYGVVLSDVIDVDVPKDLEAAERLLEGSKI